MKIYFISIIIILLLVVIFILPPIPQDLAYHQYADQRALFGIPNFSNVASNALFPLIGCAGVWLLFKKRLQIVAEIDLAYYAFFIGVIFVGGSSMYYHLNPTNSSLVWDRVGLAIIFVSFFTIIVGEYVSGRLAKLMLTPLLFSSLFSVWYWNYTESIGSGDLRLYGIVQFLPIILIPSIFLIYKARFSHAYLYWLFIGMYILAKIFEIYDVNIGEYFFGFGGHAIKHIISSGGTVVFLYLLFKRRPKQ
ncbi:MAG: hypothetical protein KBT63_07940 [Porticoccaceae bacterium]|nr:hypothetical protein [Porticoccaceae bacterium]